MFFENIIKCRTVAKSYLVVVLRQFQHFFDNGLIEFAVLTVVLQGQTLHPALLMQVQQHLNNEKRRSE